MLIFLFGGVFSVPEGLVPTQAPSDHPIRQSEQRLDRYVGSLFMRQLSAVNRIKHPTRDGDLLTIAEPHNIDLVREAAETPDLNDFLAMARVMHVFDSARKLQMCSMRRRCATALPPTCWKRAPICTPSKSCSVTNRSPPRWSIST